MELPASSLSGDRSSSPPLFPGGSRRPPDDTVFFSIFPDKDSSSSSYGDTTGVGGGEPLFSLQLHILDTVLPHFLRDYIWQHEPFSLSPSPDHAACFLCGAPAGIPHLHGKVRYGDNVEDEWFVVFLFYEVSRRIPWVSIRVWDSDGEFLLIEAAFSLPRWVNPESSENRVFVRRGELHILPRKQFPSNPTLLEALLALRTGKVDTRAPEKVQEAINKRISGYPQRARMNMHRARVRVPLPVGQVLKQEPCLIALAVEGFYDRDVDSMKYAAKMERFLRSEGGGVDIVQTSVLMSRAMYGQLMQQNFVAPRCYPMPSRDQGPVLYGEAELGMKIACGFEMMYQDRRRAGEEGKGSTVDAFKKALESHGYFEGLLPGSKEYRRRMDEALERHKNSLVFSRTRDTLGAPVRRIDEILLLPFSSSDVVGVDLPPSDDDSWLYDGEEELTSAILERQREIEVYESKHRGKQRSGDHKLSDNVPSPSDFDMGDMAKSMEAFMHKVSSFEGAEVPQSRGGEVDLDVQQFIKAMESVLGPVDLHGIAAGIELGEGETSSSDMDFDESEDESNSGKESEVEDSKDTFMQSYSDALDKELKGTTLKTSFVCAQQQFSDNRGEEIRAYRDAQGLFRREIAIRQRITCSLVDWWLDFGSDAPNLQKLAIRILSLTCSASPCERNWSTFKQVHTKKRNRLEQMRLNDLVFVQYNHRLHARHLRFKQSDLDPISLEDIDDCNEWITDHSQEQDFVHEDEDLTCLDVASGLNEGEGPSTRSSKSRCL